MLNGAYERDLSVSLFGMESPTPLFMAPVGVVGLCSQDLHGDIQVAQASAETGVPMVASTLTQDRLEDVAPHAGRTPGLFQLYTPNDRELAESFVHRAESVGYQAIVVTLDTWTTGWRPRDLHRELPPAAWLCAGELLHRRSLPEAAQGSTASRSQGGHPRVDQGVG